MNVFGRRGFSVAAPYLGMLPGLFFFALFGIGPSLATIVLSFTDITGVPNTPWHFVSLDNYYRFFALSNWRDSAETLQRTFLFSGVSTIAQNSIALGAALLLNKRLKGHLALRGLIFMPVVLGVTVIGLMWSIVLNPIGGPVSTLLAALGHDSTLLGSYKDAFPLVIMVNIWAYIGTAMLIYLAGLQGIPSELLEAASIDGASGWGKFRHITWPLLTPMVTINVMLSVIGSLKDYQIIYVLTNGANNTSVLALQVFNSAFSGSQQQGYASALSVLQFLMVLIIALLLLAFLRSREVKL